VSPTMGEAAVLVAAASGEDGVEETPTLVAATLDDVGAGELEPEVGDGRSPSGASAGGMTGRSAWLKTKPEVVCQCRLLCSPRSYRGRLW
jgi:hypothetical protein